MAGHKVDGENSGYDGRLIKGELPHNQGWIFISYRHSADGRRYASELAALLRVGGFQVWFDEDCMTPGRILDGLDRGVVPEHIAESRESWNKASRDTVIGGVLVLTEDVKTSPIIKNHEFPRLVEAYENGGFALAIANALPKIPNDGGSTLDVNAGPKGVFEDSDHVPDVSYKHYEISTNDGMLHLVTEMLNLLKEVTARRIQAQTSELKCQVLTRVEKFSHLQVGDADLHIQMKWSDDTWPEMADIDRFISLVPVHRALVDHCRREKVIYEGGIHESVAYALGAIHANRNQVEYRDSKGQHWGGQTPPENLRRFRYQEKPMLVGPEDIALPPNALRATAAEKQRIACWITLTPVPAPDLFENLIMGNPDYFDRAVRIRLQDLRRKFSPIQATTLVDELAGKLAELADKKHELHIAFQGPAGMSMLLGQALTMTEAVLYEYDKKRDGRYGPVMAVSTYEPTRMWSLDPYTPIKVQPVFQEPHHDDGR